MTWIKSSIAMRASYNSLVFSVFLLSSYNILENINIIYIVLVFGSILSILLSPFFVLPKILDLIVVLGFWINLKVTFELLSSFWPYWGFIKQFLCFSRNLFHILSILFMARRVFWCWLKAFWIESRSRVFVAWGFVVK